VQHFAAEDGVEIVAVVGPGRRLHVEVVDEKVERFAAAGGDAASLLRRAGPDVVGTYSAVALEREKRRRDVVKSRA